MYSGFTRLAPVWIGTKRGDGLADLGAEPLLLGANALERALFKQFGIMPGTPDLAALKPALIHAQFGRGGALALPIARKLRIPLAVTYHGGDATKTTHYRKRLLPAIYQRRLEALKREAVVFICVSAFVRGTLASRGFPKEKLIVLHNGVEIPPFVPAEPQPALLFAGRFTAKKGVAHLLDAMAILAANGSDVRLQLAGDGEQAEALKQRAAALPNVDLCGWLAPDALRAAMRASLAVCIPSVTAASGDAEGLPSVAIEAMALGVPVIATRHAGIAEAVTDGETGLLVPEADPQALANAAMRLAADPALRARLCAAAYATAATRFNTLTQSRQLEAVLLGLI